MASTAISIVLLAVAALLTLATLVLSAPTSTNDVSSHDSSKVRIGRLPQALDVHVEYVKNGEYKLVVLATPDVTDVTTTVSLNKVVTEVAEGVEVLQLTREGDSDTWISPTIRAKLNNKDVLHLGVHFVQEGKTEMQTVNYFSMTMFDEKDKQKMIPDFKDSSIIKETVKNIVKRATVDNADDEEGAGMLISMTMTDVDGDGNMEQLSERWGGHGGHHGHGQRGGGGHGNSDSIQIPFLPVKIPSPVNSAFGLLGGFFGGGNQNRDDGRDRHRPDPNYRQNQDWGMDGHHGGGRGNDNGWGNNGMNGWGHGHGHGHNQGNNGRWPDRHRPHNHNCHDRDGSDDSSEDGSNERPYSSTRRPGPWTTPTTQRTTRYTTRRPTTPTRTTTPTTTTEQVYDIDIRFGQGQPQAGTDNADPKPDSEKDLPAAV